LFIFVAQARTFVLHFATSVVTAAQGADSYRRADGRIFYSIAHQIIHHLLQALEITINRKLRHVFKHDGLLLAFSHDKI
jgi:hypothetical protein